jgi:branched-chain amino acid transport system ATP-binding protein
VEAIFKAEEFINAQGIIIFLFEQNIKQSLELSRRGYTVENGRIVLESPGEELLKNEHLRKVYLGI